MLIVYSDSIFRRNMFSCLLILTLSIIGIPNYKAQSTSGVMVGRVFGPTGSPLANVKVTLVNENNGNTRSSLTDTEGRYTFDFATPGLYTVLASAPGYADSNPIKGFRVPLNTVSELRPPDITLQPANTPIPTPTFPTTNPNTPHTEIGSLVNRTDATRRSNFTLEQVQSLPLGGGTNMRSFDELAFLAPGVVPPPQSFGGSIGPGVVLRSGFSVQFSVNGLRSRANNFTVDGSDSNDEDAGVRRQGYTALAAQSIESVQEFQISTLLSDPQFGRNLGAQVNVVSREGGANYRGTLYGFFTDKRLKARDPFDLKGGPASYPLIANGRPVLLNGTPIVPSNPVGGENPFTRAEYGLVFGGPVPKDSSHFFVSFERQDVNASKESNFAVPKVEERGIFQTGGSGFQVVTGQNISGVFPTSHTGDLFFSLFPFPNNPFGPYEANTYTEILPASADGNLFSIKLDRELRAAGKSHDFTARYNFTDDDTTLPVTGEALFSTLRALTRTQNFSIILNTKISSGITNQARASYGRTSVNFREVRDPFLLPSRFKDEPFLLNARLLENKSLPDIGPQFSRSGADTEFGTGLIGQVVVSGFSPIGVDVFNFPQGRADNAFQYADTIVFTRGKHRITAGADIRRSQLNSFLERNSRPFVSFSAAQDLSNLIDNQPGTLPGRITDLFIGSIAGFFLGSDLVAAGVPTNIFQTQALVPDSHIGLRFWQNNFFLFDQIRLRSNLTLTVGARYELNTVPTDVHQRIESTFDSKEVKDFIEAERRIEGVSGLEQFLAGRTSIFRQDNNNIAPHVAFAWDPFGDGKSSIRGGYAIFYDQIPGAVISQSRNVFPNFVTIHTTGIANGRANTLVGPFQYVNPQEFAAPGTLNTFAGGDPVQFLIESGIRSSFVDAGFDFVLPAPDLVTPYSQHWGLTIERQIGNDFLASASYVGTKGLHLLRFATPNLGSNAIPIIDGVSVIEHVPVLLGLVTAPGSIFSLSRPFPLLGSFTSIESDANSNYHALQLQLNKRFSHGLQITTAYTWSHALDEVSDLFDVAGSSALPQNSFDRRAEKGDANFDIRHRFVYSFVWDLPIFSRSNMLGGWRMSSIGYFQTGQPYSILFCCDLNLDGNLTDKVTPDFVFPAPRNTFQAPNIYTIDVAVDKNFTFHEHQKLQIRTEVFNVLNKTNFGVPIFAIFSGGSGIKPLFEQDFTSTITPKRTIQFALKYSF